MKTSLYTILCITIRAGAVIWAVGSVVHLPFSLVAALDTANPNANITWLACGVAFQLLVAGLLWLYPGVLARFAAGKASHQYFESSIPAAKLQYIAFSVVGIWFVLEGLVFLSYELVQAAQFEFESLPVKLPVMASSSARIVFGLALMFGARGLAGLLNSIREKGGPVPTAMDDANM